MSISLPHRVDEGERSLKQRCLTSSTSSDGDMFSPAEPSPGSSTSSVSVGGASDLHTECVHDPIPIIHETRQNPFSNANPNVKDTRQCSPVSSLMSNSTGASISASNSPELLSSAVSVGLLSPTNSLGLQSTAYSPGIQSATNSPGLQSTTYSPGLQSTTYSPGLQSATYTNGFQSPANGPGIQSITYSPGHQSTTYSPGHQSAYSPGHQSTYSPGHQSTYSPGLQSTYSPGHQSAYSPGLQSATNSPAMLSTANSPGQLSHSSSSGFSSTNVVAPHPRNGYHGNNAMCYCDFPPDDTEAGHAVGQSHCRPINSSPGLLTYANGQQMPIHTTMAPQALHPTITVSASNHVAMVPGPPSVHRGVPSSIPSSVNATYDVHDVDFNQFLSELDSISFKA